MDAMNTFGILLLQAGPGEAPHVRVNNHGLSSFSIMLDGQKVLLVDLQVLHHEHAVAHETLLVRPWQNQVLSKHFFSNLLHLVN